MLLVLFSAFLHALWNAFLRRQEDKDSTGVVVVTLAALVAGGVALVSALTTDAVAFPNRTALVYSLAAGLFEAGYFISLVQALTAGPLGPVYTVSRGGAILAVWPISALWLAEPVTAFSLAGSALLCVGLVASGMQRSVPRRALALAAACAVFIAGYHLCYKRALGSGGAPPAVFAVSLALATPLQILRLGRARFPAMWRALAAHPFRLIGVGAVCSASFLVFLAALRDGGAGFVLTLRNTSILFATALGWLIGEPPTRRQIIGSILVAAGAMLLGIRR